MVKERRAKTRLGGSLPQIWLAIDTATEFGSVAVWRDGLAIEQTLRIQGAHSERVLPAIAYALEVSQTLPEEVSAFVVGSGPGSFTGVRVAASLAKGWAMARGTPLFAYSSLLAMAAGSGAYGPVCALFDARRREVYAACYEMTVECATELLAPAAWRIDQLLAELAGSGIEPVFTGEGAIVHRDAITKAFAAARVLPEHLTAPRASSLLWLRNVAPELGRVERPEVWEPLYVRDWKVPEESERR
jgi:tRNA threonylcarbamoyladenosine biosynthesis protein TsaB